MQNLTVLRWQISTDRYCPHETPEGRKEGVGESRVEKTKGKGVGMRSDKGWRGPRRGGREESRAKRERQWKSRKKVEKKTESRKGESRSENLCLSLSFTFPSGHYYITDLSLHCTLTSTLSSSPSAPLQSFDREYSGSIRLFTASCGITCQ